MNRATSVEVRPHDGRRAREVFSELAARWIPLGYSNELADVLRDLGRPGVPVSFVARQ